jgi:hypothetical protein
MKEFALNGDSVQAVAFPMVFWNVEIHLGSNAIQKLVSVLTTHESLGRDYWSSFRNIWVSNLLQSTRSPEQRALQRLLSRTRVLQAADLAATPPYVMQTLTLSCQESLRSLTMYNIRDVPYAGLFLGLRRLDIIFERIAKPYAQLKDDAAWRLPQLESLRWVELDRPWGRYHNRAVRFLSGCHFPRLRQAHLNIDVSEIHPDDDENVDDDEDEDDEDDGNAHEEGPELLHDFLTAHPTIDDLSFTIFPDAYAHVLPAVRARRLGLHACSQLSSFLFTHLPPSVTVLKLPVYLTEEEDDEADIRVPIEEMLHSLLGCTRAGETHVKEVHLSIGKMWDSPGYDDDVLAALPLHFAREAENDNPQLLKELGVIFQAAVKLQEHGITVHDERGMTFQDYFSASAAHCHERDRE